MTKRITIVGYLKDQEGSLREVADSMVEEDMLEQEENQKSEYFLQHDTVKIKLTNDEYEAMKDKDAGEFEVVEETEIEEEYTTYLHKPAKRIVADFYDEVVDQSLPDGYRTYWGDSVKRGDTHRGDTVVSMSKYLKKTPLLVHPEKMEPGNVVVDEDEKYNAIKVKVTIQDVTESEMKMLEPIVNASFVDYLSNLEQIGRVRWTDCKKETKEEYVCFNV